MDHRVHNLRLLLAVLVIILVLPTTSGRHVRFLNARSAAGTVRKLHAHSADDAAVDPAVAAAGAEDSIIANRYIVSLESGFGDASTAAAALVEEVRTALQTAGAARANAAAAAAAADAAAIPSAATTAAAAATQEAPAADTAATAVEDASSQTAAAAPLPAEDDIAILKVGQAAAAADLGAATAAVGSEAPAAVVVLRASLAAIKAVRASARVKAVVPDRYVRAQARGLSQATPACVTSAAMRSGVRLLSTAVKPNLNNAFTALGCNVGSARYVWKGDFCRGSLSNINFTEVSAFDNSGKQLLTPKGARCRLVRGPNGPVNAQRFGGCGVPPALAASLPMRVCSATGGGGGKGSVGTTPAGSVLPRVPVEPLEQVPSGVSLIEASARNSVGNMKAGKTVVVAVVDSGIDAEHPDLKQSYLGGKAFMVPSTVVAGDSADPASDLYGHGTHVAGIVGALNQNFGVVGVAPGVGLYSLKILDAQGVGSLSDAMDAVSWAAGPEGQAQGVRVINLSLAAAVDPTSADYADTVALVCDAFRRASNAGIIVAAAAGNYGADIRGYLPAACPSVIAVTSMDPASGSPSTFSNFLAEPATAAEKGGVMAAPGNAINSTISYAREDSGYRELSGTSMASPHVAGVAAACIASGACAEPTGFANSAVLQAAARERLQQQPPYGFSGDARSTGTGKYYGNLVWAKW